jgi:transposase-like protein
MGCLLKISSGGLKLGAGLLWQSRQKLICIDVALNVSGRPSGRVRSSSRRPSGPEWVLRHWPGVGRSRRVATMCSCPRCSSSDLTRDGRDERGRVVYACAGCGRHATAESTSLVAGHRFPRDVILLAVRYYLQLGAAAERIAGILADRGIDVSGRTILRWVQKFGPALADAVRQHRRSRRGWWTRPT